MECSYNRIWLIVASCVALVTPEHARGAAHDPTQPQKTALAILKVLIRTWEDNGSPSTHNSSSNSNTSTSLPFNPGYIAQKMDDAALTVRVQLTRQPPNSLSLSVSPLHKRCDLCELDVCQADQYPESSIHGTVKLGAIAPVVQALQGLQKERSNRAFNSQVKRSIGTPVTRAQAFKHITDFYNLQNNSTVTCSWLGAAYDKKELMARPKHLPDFKSVHRTRTEPIYGIGGLDNQNQQESCCLPFCTLL